VTAAAGALLAAIADKLAVALETAEDASSKMFCDIDPFDPPDDLPREYADAWRAAYTALSEVQSMVAEAGATADAGAQAHGELATSSLWMCRPACVAPLYAVRQGGAA
jgi:hypothetical protein